MSLKSYSTISQILITDGALTAPSKDEAIVVDHHLTATSNVIFDHPLSLSDATVLSNNDTVARYYFECIDR